MTPARRPLLMTFCLAALACIWPAAAQDAPPAAPQPEAQQPQEQAPQDLPPPGLTVRDLVVFQIDRNGTRANDPREVRTTLVKPIDHVKRPSLQNEDGGYANTPMPLGLITFQGEIAKPMTLQVKLPDDAGLRHAQWPPDANITDTSIQWLSVREAQANRQAQPLLSVEPHWLLPLREGEDRLWVQSRDPIRKERFVLYDVSVPYATALGLKLDNEQYRLEPQPPAGQPKLTLLVRQSEQGWVSDTLAAPWPGDRPIIGQVKNPAQQPATADQALAPLADLLKQRGYNDTETKLALSMAMQAGIAGNDLSLLYVLEDEELDGLIELTIKPEPDRLIRTAIVVVTNADPDLGSRIDKLVKQLGSEAWLEREAAQQQLIDLGVAAVKRMQDERNNSKDPEVAFRAQQVLNAFDEKFELDYEIKDKQPSEPAQTIQRGVDR